VVEILYILLLSELWCLSLNLITCAGFIRFFYRFQIRKSSCWSIAKNSQIRTEKRTCSENVLSAPTTVFKSSKYNLHHLIYVIGLLQRWYHTVMGDVY